MGNPGGVFRDVTLIFGHTYGVCPRENDPMDQFEAFEFTHSPHVSDAGTLLNDKKGGFAPPSLFLSLTFVRCNPASGYADSLR